MMRSLYHWFLRSLHKLCLASISVKTSFKNPINGIENPVLVVSKNVEERKKALFYKTKKKRGKNNIFREV